MISIRIIRLFSFVGSNGVYIIEEWIDVYREVEIRMMLVKVVE